MEKTDVAESTRALIAEGRAAAERLQQVLDQLEQRLVDTSEAIGEPTGD